jgi:hypothetical protein
LHGIHQHRISGPLERGAVELRQVKVSFTKNFVTIFCRFNKEMSLIGLHVPVREISET